VIESMESVKFGIRMNEETSRGRGRRLFICTACYGIVVVRIVLVGIMHCRDLIVPIQR